jgi:hypothetical protein
MIYKVLYTTVSQYPVTFSGLKGPCMIVYFFDNWAVGSKKAPCVWMPQKKEKNEVLLLVDNAELGIWGLG